MTRLSFPPKKHPLVYNPVRIVTVLILNAMVASWHPAGATLAESWSWMLSCNLALDLLWMASDGEPDGASVLAGLAVSAVITD